MTKPFFALRCREKLDRRAFSFHKLIADGGIVTFSAGNIQLTIDQTKTGAEVRVNIRF